MLERGSKIPESRPFSKIPEETEKLINSKAEIFNKLAEIKAQIELLQQNPNNNASRLEELKSKKEELEEELEKLTEEIKEAGGENL